MRMPHLNFKTKIGFNLNLSYKLLARARDEFFSKEKPAVCSLLFCVSVAYLRHLLPPAQVGALLVELVDDLVEPPGLLPLDQLEQLVLGLRRGRQAVLDLVRRHHVRALGARRLVRPGEELVQLDVQAPAWGSERTRGDDIQREI